MYITAAAVRQYMAIQGYEGSSHGPVFDLAAIELENLCESAKPSGSVRKVLNYRVAATIRGVRSRLELTVSTETKKEGDMPQLIGVRERGRGGYTH